MISSKNISNTLIDIRNKLKVSKSDFADMLGISTSHLLNLEKGLKNPTLDLVEKLIFEFEIPPSQIFSKEEISFDTDDRLKNLESKMEKILDALSIQNDRAFGVK